VQVGRAGSGSAHAPTPYFLALDTSVQLPWLSIRLGLGSGMWGFTPCEAACMVASSTHALPSQLKRVWRDVWRGGSPSRPRRFPHFGECESACGHSRNYARRGGEARAT
jgi:hypothetical protein